MGRGVVSDDLGASGLSCIDSTRERLSSANLALIDPAPSLASQLPQGLGCCHGSLLHLKTRSGLPPLAEARRVSWSVVFWSKLTLNPVVGQRLLHAAIIHLLASYYGDRLRRFANRQRRASGRRHCAGGVGARVLGGSAEALGRNIGRAQLQRLIGFDRSFSGLGVEAQQRQRQRAQGKTKTDVRHGVPFASNRSVVEVLLRG